jgi:hypothetical protein
MGFDECLYKGLYITIGAKTCWSGTSYRRIHFLPFTRDGLGYAQYTPFINLWNLESALASSFLFVFLENLQRATKQRKSGVAW